VGVLSVSRTALVRRRRLFLVEWPGRLPGGDRSVSNHRCVFCEIVAGRASAHVVAEDELSLCLLDINPFTEGHCLVVSKRHVPWWHDLTEPETVSLFLMAKRVAHQLNSAFGSDFVCLYARGRRVPHTHIFLVPTRQGDVLDGFFNALERFQESPPALTALRGRDTLAATAARIRGAEPAAGAAETGAALTVARAADGSSAAAASGGTSGRSAGDRGRRPRRGKRRVPGAGG